MRFIKEKKLTIIQCTEADMKDVLTLMDAVEDTTTRQEWFVKDDASFVMRHVSKEGFILGIREKKKLVAYLLIRIPKFDEDNLGRDIHLKKADLKRVAHIESVGVDLEHRGNGYMRMLMRKAEKHLKKMGIKYFMATIAPKNKYSLRNFIKKGYVVVKRKKKYDGLDRVIVKKDV